METQEEMIVDSEVSKKIIGHEEQIGIVNKALSSAQMPHAWMLSGIRGIGKYSFAIQLSRLLLSGDFSDRKVFDLYTNVDDRTNSLVDAGTHPDLLVLKVGELDKDGKEITQLTVENARSIGGFLRLTSSISKNRIVVIDSIDEMNRNAANAILKLVEEPPKNSFIFLISHSPGKVLPTIRSRCRQLKFKPLSHDNLANIVRNNISDSNSFNLKNDELEELVSIAEGSPGRAIEYLENDGIKILHKIYEILNSIPNIDIVKLHDLAASVALKSNLQNWKITTYLYRWILSQIIFAKQVSSNQTVSNSVNPELISKLSLESLLGIWEKTGKLIDDTENLYLDKKAVMIDLFNQMNNAYQN